MDTDNSKPPRIPAADRCAGAAMARWPRMFRWLAGIETRELADAINAVRIERPVYIAGLARAGTTLLLELLAEAPGFTSLRYADFPSLWTPYWGQWLRSRLSSAATVPTERAHRDRILVTRESPEALEEPFWMHFFPGRHEPGVDQILAADVDAPEFLMFYQAHIRKLLLARAGQRYLAKGNYNLSRIDYLLQVFPDARFIVAVREPIAQIGSLLKQDRLFSEWGRLDPAISRQMERSGHFEFGLHKRAINMGDASESAAIQACFDSGRASEGYARQWAASYGWLAGRLAESPRMRDACLIVDYEGLCADPEQLLAAIHAHIGVEPDQAALLRKAQVPRVSRPEYPPGLSDAEREIAVKVTSRVWRSLVKRE